MLTAVIKIEKQNRRVGLQLASPGEGTQARYVGARLGGKGDGTVWGRAVGA